MKDLFSYLLVNDQQQIYTQLNQFDARKQLFQGEFSLVHNMYSYDAFFLSKFLFASKNQPLFLLNSQHDRYQEITSKYDRFLENDVPRYIEEKQQKSIEQKQDHLMDKNLGQLQLSITKGLVEKQLEDVKTQSANSPSEHQVLLGKELALQWVLHTIEEIVEKGN